MTPASFIEWRLAMGFSKRGAAKALGASPSTITAYDTGASPIPRYIALACRALYHRLEPWGESKKAGE